MVIIDVAPFPPTIQRMWVTYYYQVIQLIKVFELADLPYLFTKSWVDFVI